MWVKVKLKPINWELFLFSDDFRIRNGAFQFDCSKKIQGNFLVLVKV
jgi:hypothetical protein